MTAYTCASFNGCTTKLTKAMNGILKLKLVNPGFSRFVLKHKRVLAEKKIVGVDEEGNEVLKNVYRYELDEKFCKERYDQMVDLLPLYNGALVISGIEKNGKNSTIDVINCNNELKNSFKKSVKKGMGRYEWMKSNLMEGKYKMIDFHLGVKA